MVPIRREHRGGEVAAGRMSVDHHAAAEATPEIEACAAHLLDDDRDRNLRAEIVAGDRNGDAACVEPRRHMTEHRGLERSPVAAVHEYGEGSMRAAFGTEEIERLARGRTIDDAEFGPPGRRGSGAVARRLALPAGEDAHVLRYPSPIVVLGFEIGPHGAPPAENRCEGGRSRRPTQDGCLGICTGHWIER